MTNNRAIKAWQAPESFRERVLQSERDSLASFLFFVNPGTPPQFLQFLGVLYELFSVYHFYITLGLLQFSWCNLAFEANERIARTGGAQRMGH